MSERQPTASMPASGIVVAGGRSRRMGQDKRQLKLWGDSGPTLLQHTVDLVASLCAEVIVVLNDPEAWTQLSARIVPDVYPDGGALGGIYSGLAAATHEHALVIAADMPLLNLELLRWMVAQPRDYDVLVPQLGSGRARNRLGVESLHAIYSRNCLEPIARQLDAGNPQVIGFYPEVRVRLMEPPLIAQFDPAGDAFRNVNTPEDLDVVRELLARS
ncbi:MAG: molybdenum cofactor guanylyltransferase [Chloroflexi bacterium]|nr:molybdenum cofactor guanylyltransferase [Chloroflexota bacterium]